MDFKVPPSCLGPQGRPLPCCLPLHTAAGGRLGHPNGLLQLILVQCDFLTCGALLMYWAVV